MAKSELVDAIRDDYLASHTEVVVSQVDDFCQYIVSWLSDKGLVGLGHAVNGISVRTADGGEIELLSYDMTPGVADSPAVTITSSRGTTKPMLGNSPDFGITGR